MSVRTIDFNDVISAAAAAGATKSVPHNFYHTWDGWVSRDVLHVVSRSSAKRRPIWHFPIARYTGQTLCMKNTTGTADVWAKSAGVNPLEIFVHKLNPLAGVEYMDVIDTEMLLYGTDCGHNPGNNLDWWRILADGEVTITKDAPRCERGPRHHIGCPEGTADVHVTGGTYAIQWYNKFQIRRVVVAPDADLDRVALHIRVQHDLWSLLEYDDHLRTQYRWEPYETEGKQHARQLELLELAAEGKLPANFVKQLATSARWYTKILAHVSQELYDRVMVYHPDSVERRSLTDEIVRLIGDASSHQFRVAQSRRAGEMLFILPMDEEVRWQTDDIYGPRLNDRLSGWGSQCSSGHAVDKNPSESVDSLPVWAEEAIRRQCDATQLCDLRHVPDNIRMAGNLAVIVYREEFEEWPKKVSALLKSGRANEGWGRVQWNRWWDRR